VSMASSTSTYTERSSSFVGIDDERVRVGVRGDSALNEDNRT